jgi:hypothetical protein
MRRATRSERFAAAKMGFPSSPSALSRGRVMAVRRGQPRLQSLRALGERFARDAAAVVVLLGADVADEDDVLRRRLRYLELAA